MIKIGKLNENRWKEYRTLRLESLKNDPCAFGSSYQEELKLTKAEWKNRIKDALFALHDGKPYWNDSLQIQQ